MDKLTVSNLNDAVRKMKGHFNQRSNCKLLVIRHKDNLYEISDFGDKTEFEDIVYKMQKGATLNSPFLGWD